jgi:hypothetical protein
VHGRRIALDEFGKQGDLRLLDLAADVMLRNTAGWTPGVARALEHLATGPWPPRGPGSTVTMSHSAKLGTGILSKHGDNHDAGPS